jgi:alpha-tubulin suppressor-like RCC1 family protein
MEIENVFSSENHSFVKNSSKRNFFLNFLKLKKKKEFEIFFFGKNEDGESGLGTKENFKEIKKLKFFDDSNLKIKKISCGIFSFTIFLTGSKNLIHFKIFIF